MSSWKKTLTAKTLTELEALVNLQKSVKPVGVVTEGGRGYRVSYTNLEAGELQSKYKLNLKGMHFERI